MIYVFGSNLAGRHGKGTALIARQKHGAIYGQAEGLQGRSYGIATKDHALKPRPLPAINESVREFLAFAEAHPEMTFLVNRIGCGNAGYFDADIAPMFRRHPRNVILPVGFERALTMGRRV